MENACLLKYMGSYFDLSLIKIRTLTGQLGSRCCRLLLENACPLIDRASYLDLTKTIT